jgi:diaminopimelate decarboxylase
VLATQSLTRVEVNLDSLGQLAAWFRCGGTSAGIRVNAATLGGGLRRDRIVIDATDVPRAVSVALASGGRLTGLHVYLGTNFARSDAMMPSLERLFETASGVASLDYVNLGGGIGVDYQHLGERFDLDALGAAVARCAARLRHTTGRDIDVIVEPGRGLVAECGTFITAVTDVKTRNGERYAAVDGSIAIFPRPLHHPETPHRVRLLRGGQKPLHPTTLVGRTTFSKDIIEHAALQDDLAVGDLLAVEDAGAYSQSMASRFLGQREPAVCYLDDGCGLGGGPRALASISV